MFYTIGMAFLLLIYVVFMLVWAYWACSLSYILLKYRYPKGTEQIQLAIFWSISILLISMSAIFIARADWVSVPNLNNFLGNFR